MKKIKTYPSGLRLIVNTLKSYPSVVSAIGVATGGVNDPKGKEGISHFVEHVCFKGTEKRNAKQIAIDFENFGAEVNAFTSPYFTVYYAKSLHADVGEVFSILSDIILNSKYENEELEKEKGVVLEEIAMQEDKPYSVVSRLLEDYIYAGTELSEPVLGYKETVNGISREDVVNYIKSRYVPENMIISFAGKITLKEAESLIEKHMHDLAYGKVSAPVVFEENKSVFSFSGKTLYKKKNVEQTHVMMAFPSEGVYSKNIDGINLLANILGDGMSSRLFQEIREKLGLVYTIYAHQNSNISSGDISIYFATGLKNTDKAISVIKKQLALLKEKPVPHEELERAKKLIINDILMSSEALKNVAIKEIKRHFTKEKPISEAKLIKRINNVTAEQIQELANKIFNFDNLVVAILSSKEAPQEKL